MLKPKPSSTLKALMAFDSFTPKNLMLGKI